MHTPTIPDHALIRGIGRGSYGEVWLAHNVMGRARAVKVIWRRQFESEKPFEREYLGIQRYEPVSRSSGGLVHVLHVGKNEDEGYFYYVMELADDAARNQECVISNPREAGNPELEMLAPHSLEAAIRPVDSYQPRTLRSDLKRLRRLSTADCLRLALDVAGGLAELHRHGLIHRDVKPGNIIYVNDRAKLADIGLVTTEGEGRTFVGTEGYIPPEGPGSPAADLYALGVVLYEASTGLPPERLPDVPSEWFTAPEGDEALELHEVILKACEGQRERRYSNAESMQADLALLQSGQSLRHRRALQRRYACLKLVGAAGSTLLVLAVMAALIAGYRARVAAKSRAEEAQLRHQAQQSQARAERAEHEATRQLQAALYEEARALVLSKELGHRTRALEATRRASGSTNAAELRRVAFAALGLADLRLERETDLPTEFAFPALSSLDPTLERIAIVQSNGPVSICSLPDFKVQAVLPPTTELRTFWALWSPDGRFLAVKRQYDGAGTRCDLEVWNVGQKRLLFTARQDIAYTSFSFHPRLPRFIAGHIGGEVSVWDLENVVETRPFRLPETPYAMSYSPDGERFATSHQHGSNWVVAFHDAASGRRIGATECPEPVEHIAWHPRGSSVGIVGDGISEWDRGVWLAGAEGDTLSSLGQHRLKTSDVNFSPDGDFLMSCGWERDLFCWDLRTGQKAFSCVNAGYRMYWSTDGVHCATVSQGLHLQVYAFTRPACIELADQRGERLRPGAFSPDGRFLAIPGEHDLCLWELTRSSRPTLLTTDRGPLQAFFSEDSKTLFAVSGSLGDARLQGWQLGAVTRTNESPEAVPLEMTVPPRLNWAGLRGHDLVLTSEEGVRFVSLTNLLSGRGRIVKIPPGQGTVSPDGQWLAVTYSYSPFVNVYRLPGMEPVKRLETSHFVGGVWFAPCGEEMIVINRRGIEQWDTTTWQLRRRQPGFPVSEGYVIYTPDGSGLWQLTTFHDASLYDRKTFEPILPLPANVLPLALSSDGRQLAVSVDDRSVQVWDLVELRKHFQDLGLGSLATNSSLAISMQTQGRF
jgi:WD40 repeat protein